MNHTKVIPNCRPIVLMPDGSIDKHISSDDRLFFDGWQPITEANEKDIEESLRMQRAIRAVPSQCWFNARKVVLKMEQYAHSSYIEGWAILEGCFPIEHGWVVRDGVIVDPTLPDCRTAYFPGLEFNGRTGINEFLATPKGKKCKRSPFFFAFGFGGMDSPSFRRCYDQMNEALK